MSNGTKEMSLFQLNLKMLTEQDMEVEEWERNDSSDFEETPWTPPQPEEAKRVEAKQFPKEAIDARRERRRESLLTKKDAHPNTVRIPSDSSADGSRKSMKKMVNPLMYTNYEKARDEEAIARQRHETEVLSFKDDMRKALASKFPETARYEQGTDFPDSFDREFEIYKNSLPDEEEPDTEIVAPPPRARSSRFPTVSVDRRREESRREEMLRREEAMRRPSEIRRTERPMPAGMSGGAVPPVTRPSGLSERERAEKESELFKNKEVKTAPEETAVAVQNPEAEKPNIKNIDGKEIPVGEQQEQKQNLKEREKHRSYTRKAEMEKIIFRKPKEVGGNFLKTLVMFSVACVATGIFLGVQGLSYYNYMGGKVEGGALACAWSWLMVDNLPIRLNPFNGEVFSTCFFAGFVVLAVVGLFIYLDTDAKKQSRVGHEHGAAHLGTPRDFKGFKAQFMENNDNNMLFGKYKGQELGLSLNNKKVNRSANVLVIGGTGTGKTFKYIKPNLLQENCSVVVTDPSGDIFRSFAPYLLSKGYNVYLFNASDFSMSNHYNPLLNVYDANGGISERHVNILVDLYMKNAKEGNEQGSSDPFWDKSEKAFLTALIYYVLENDNIPRRKKCFSTILECVQKARVSDDDDVQSPLTLEMNEWFYEVGIIDNIERDPDQTFMYRYIVKEGNEKGQIKEEKREGIVKYSDTLGTTKYKTKLYYDTFLIAPQKTANTILMTTAVDLQIFATKEVDFITQEDEEHKEMNIDIDKIATQQSYLFLGIPQSHQAYNFLIAMLYSQLYGRLYELGEQKLRNKWHIGYKLGCPVFDYFDTEEEAKHFYETISKDDIIENSYINNTKMYNLMYNGKCYKSSVLREPLEKFIDTLDQMYIWNADDFAGGDPALPIHINFLLDEFKNIGEIPNFLTILSTSRKYRIGSHCVIQDIGQIKTMYKDGEHETLMANVDTVIFLGSNLKEDKEELQKMLGKTTIRQKSTSSSNSGLSTSYTPTEVDLMSLDEIGAINQNGRDDELVIIRDVTPYLCRKLNLTEHKRWKDVQAVKGLNIDATKYYKNSVEVDIHK